MTRRVVSVPLAELLESSQSSRERVDALRGALLAGEVAAIPTESTYGLAVDPRSEIGVEHIFALKGREDTKPLLVVVAEEAQAEAIGIETTHPLWTWASEFWPAPLTVIVPTRRALPAQRGAPGLAVRVPAHEGLRQLLLLLGFGITATSANRSGSEALVELSAVRQLLAGIGGWVIDEGNLEGGIASTVVAWNAERKEPVVLRQGGFVFESSGFSEASS